MLKLIREFWKRAPIAVSIAFVTCYGPTRYSIVRKVDLKYALPSQNKCIDCFDDDAVFLGIDVSKNFGNPYLSTAAEDGRNQIIVPHNFTITNGDNYSTITANFMAGNLLAYVQWQNDFESQYYYQGTFGFGARKVSNGWHLFFDLGLSTYNYSALMVRDNYRSPDGEGTTFLGRDSINTHGSRTSPQFELSVNKELSKQLLLGTSLTYFYVSDIRDFGSSHFLFPVNVDLMYKTSSWGNPYLGVTYYHNSLRVSHPLVKVSVGVEF